MAKSYTRHTSKFGVVIIKSYNEFGVPLEEIWQRHEILSEKTSDQVRVKVVTLTLGVGG